MLRWYDQRRVAGSGAAEAFKTRQGRKDATVRRHFRVSQGRLATHFTLILYTAAGNSMIDPRNHQMMQGGRALRWLGIPIAIVIAIAIVVLLIVAYLNSFNSTTIVDDGYTHIVRTQETTVEGTLRDAGISLHGEDLIEPALDAPIQQGTIIVIRRAHLVRVFVEGQEPRLVRTQRENARDLLSDVGYSISLYDSLRVNGKYLETLPQVPTDTLGGDAQVTATVAAEPVIAEVEIRRAVSVTVAERGAAPVKIHTTATTVGEAMLQAGSIVYIADHVEPGLGTHLTSGMTITIDRAKPVTVWVDGSPLQTRSHANTVGGVLAEMNVMLLEDDYTRPALDEPIQAGGEVHVVRVMHKLEIRREPIDFETYWEPNDSLELDSEALAQDGVPGVRELRDRVVYEDGTEIGRNQVVNQIITAVQNRIYNYGTKIVVRDLPTSSGSLQYWRKIRMTATSYSASTSGVSRSVSWYGIARCGQALRRGIVAVDPYVVPLGTTVYVEGYGAGLACDTGSGVIGKHIDLGYGDADFENWYRSVDVYILTPVPLNPRYRLN